MGRYGWRNEDGVVGTSRTTTDFIVECRDCDWDQYHGTVNAKRTAARRHAALNKHRVAVSHTTLMEYHEDRKQTRPPKRLIETLE